jgi:hypothetical protein
LKASFDQRSKHFSILRLICFIAMAFSVYQCFVTAYLTIQIIMSVLFLIFFLALVKRHDKIQRRRDWVERMLLINSNELNVLQNKPSVFDNGMAYFSTDSYYYDLDIFGEGSVYHLLNRTGTTIGANALADQLKIPLSDIEEICQQQNAISELSQHTDFRQQITAAGMKDKGKASDIKNIQAWFDSDKNLSKSWWKYVIAAGILLLITALIYCIVTGNYYFITPAFLLNLGTCIVISKGISEAHNKLSGAGKLLEQYADIFSIISNSNFSNNLLSGIHKISHNADKRLKSLASIIDLFDQRINFLVAVFFNGFFFYDLLCVMKLEKWKKTNAHYVNDWFKSLAKIDALNSFATYAFNNPQYTAPSILSDNEQIIEAKSLAHPLIPADKRVSNHVSFGAKSKVILITGSNMSGKSTFLRTVGVNMLLASCGAPVCASEFGFYPVKIYTSLRQSDSLQEDTSFFYAELKKLGKIVKNLEAGEKAIVMLDEVLKGTNSDDKTYGSQELIHRLVHFNALSLIATHDITLGKMEKESEGLIENYCFESAIENDELLFDYKLHKGIAVNKNATFLMRKMGIIS